MAYQWATWLLPALRAEGCKVREHPGWRTRGRPGTYNPRGVGLHHTGTPTSMARPNPTLNIIVKGRPDLPGPLAAGLIGYDGTIDLVAAGRTNHGGKAKATGPMPAGDANALYVGFEIDYSGKQAMSEAQHDAAVRAGAAVLRHFKRSADYARQHSDWTLTGKWDCGQWESARMRTEIAARLKTAPPAGGGGEDDDVTKPSDIVGADSDGTQLTMSELSARMNWLYQQWLEAGSLNEQLDRIEQKLDALK